MNRSDLISNIHARLPSLTHDDATIVVSAVLAAIAKTLASGDPVEIRGFGSFGLHYRPSRTGRNPRSGEKVAVPGKYVLHFKAAKELRKRVDFGSEKAKHITLDQSPGTGCCDSAAHQVRVWSWRLRSS